MNNGSILTQRYQQTSVNTATPEQLVVMLYEGAIQALKKAVAAIEQNDLEQKRTSVDRTLGLIQHLQNTLDMERGGEIAADLDRLYTYMTSRIMEASTTLDAAPLREVIKLVSPLMEAWKEVARKKQESLSSEKALSGGQPNARLQVHG